MSLLGLESDQLVDQTGVILRPLQPLTSMWPMIPSSNPKEPGDAGDLRGRPSSPSRHPAKQAFAGMSNGLQPGVGEEPTSPLDRVNGAENPIESLATVRDRLRE